MAVDNSENFLEIESPRDSIPDLAALGIEEVDRGVCEDTADNRFLVRQAGLNFSPLYTIQGADTSYIQVYSTEQRKNTLLHTKSAILVNPDDPNSDYLSDIDLLMESDTANIVPIWVVAATKRWVKVERERKSKGSHFTPSLAQAPQRCRKVRADGLRCAYWSPGTAAFDGLCRVHLTKEEGRDNTAQLVKARNRLQSASLKMVEVLETLALEGDSEPTRLGAANSLLDRAGLRAGMEIELGGKVEVENTADRIRERLAALAPKPVGEIVAEVVEDER